MKNNQSNWNERTKKIVFEKDGEKKEKNQNQTSGTKMNRLKDGL